MVPAAIFDYLDRHHAKYSLLSHRRAFTAQEEAAAAHVPGHAWAKTVVCFADETPILAVVPAPCRVDLTRLRRTVQARSVRVAHENEFSCLFEDCEVGAMPPLGPLYGQRVFVDASLARDTVVSFSAGSHQDAIRMPFDEFQRIAKPTVADFAAERSPSPPARAETHVDPVCGTSTD